MPGIIKLDYDVETVVDLTFEIVEKIFLDHSSTKPSPKSL